MPITRPQALVALHEAEKPVCHKLVSVKGGQALAGMRNCSGKVTYTDPQGRSYCKKHEPDDESKKNREAIAKVMGKTAAP